MCHDFCNSAVFVKTSSWSTKMKGHPARWSRPSRNRHVCMSESAVCHPWEGICRKRPDQDTSSATLSLAQAPADSPTRTITKFDIELLTNHFYKVAFSNYTRRVARDGSGCSHWNKLENLTNLYSLNAAADTGFRLLYRHLKAPIKCKSISSRRNYFCRSATFFIALFKLLPV